MPVRRDSRTGRWFFRATVKLPDGTRRRIFGTPGVPGRYQDLAASKVGAQEAERRAIAELMTGKPAQATPATKEVPTLRSYSRTFLDVYAASHKPSSRLDKRQRLNAYILPALGDMRLDAIRQEDVDRLVAGLLRRGLDRKTVNNVTAVLSSLMRYAARNKVIAPVELTFTIKVQDTEIDAVKPADVDRLVEAATDPRYRAAILLAADAGLRIGEIRALTWGHVNEVGRELTVAQAFDRSGELSDTKGRKRRTVPISDRLWTALRPLDRSTGYVICRQGGGALGYDATREAVRAIYGAAGVEIPAKPWHSLRHGFCTALANAGVPIHVIRELAGHESIETTLRYMHTGRAAKRDAIAALRGSHVAAESGDSSQLREK